MLFRKLWRTMGLYKAQFISMIIMIALGIGMFVGFNMEWVTIKENTSYLFKATGFADYRIVSETGFTDKDLKTVKDIDGVKKAAKFLSVNTDVKSRGGDSIALTVTTDEKVSGMYLIKGEKYDKNSADGVWISDKYASENDFKIGDNITFVYKGLEIAGKIKGLIKSGEHMICVRDESQLMPDFKTHGFAYISPKMYEKATGAAYYNRLNIVSDLSSKKFKDAADDAFGKTVLVLTKDEVISYKQAEGESDEGKTMGSVLPVLFLLIAVLTMVTTMHRLTAKEKTQIGTLKALGFKDRRILVHYTSYAFIIGILGSAIGIGLGYAVAYFIMNPNGMMGTYLDMPRWKLCFPWFCRVILAAIIILLTFIGFLSVRQMLKGTAADALRPYAPKKMKPLAIEKTKWFHNLSFGTRWNLRDITRHKSRTAMSFIGIIGCMTLMVGSLGLGNTMDAFLDTYYDGATKYSSRIYFSEDATQQDKQRITDKYDGDWSASLSVQLDGETIALDVYNVEHKLVRFPDKNNDYPNLPDNGAFICSRIADEYNLSVGDTFKVSPYGSDKKYTVKVAGVMCSVSKNVVISSKYAKQLKIPYSVDSVYTSAEKSDVATDAAIKTVQSKQMIIDSFDSFTEIMNSMIIVMIGGALLLGVVVLYNLGVMSYTERYREMATLKVVGFKDKKIGSLLIGQNMWVSIIGTAVGIPCGAGVLDYLLKKMAPEYEMRMSINASTYIISIALSLGMSLLVSLAVARKNKHIDMVEALKFAE